MTEPSPKKSDSSHYAVRRMRAEDAPVVVDCVLDVYGSTYPKPALYDSHRLAELVANEHWIAAVIEFDNAIVAYSALELSQTGPIAEFGMAMVRKSHRRKGLLEKLSDYIWDVAMQMGLHGRYVEIGTWDVTLQKLVDRSPPKPCALTLTLWPNIDQNQEFIESESFQRLSFLRYFHYLKLPNDILACSPEHHRDMIERIFAQYNLPLVTDREFVRPELIDVSMVENEALGYAEIRIPWLSDSSAVGLARLVDSFHNNSKIKVLYLEFPLGQTECGAFCEYAENLGFFFSGVMPCAFGTDAGLRLQSIKCDAQFPIQQIGDPFGRELLAYVARAAERL